MTIRSLSSCALLALCASCVGLSCVGLIGDDETSGSAAPGNAPLRRLTRFEYNNTARDLLGDATEPANQLPSEELGNGFGNDAEAQSVSSLLVESYNLVAENIAIRATETPEALGKLDPCGATIGASTDSASEEACARTIVERFTTLAFRRPVEAAEIDELLALRQTIRNSSEFATSIAAVIEAVLQSPDFLYRLEWGVPDPADGALRRPSGYEMATRLSYLFWGTQPDETLRQAATTGELLTNEGVLAHAQRMIDDPRSRPVIRFFFDNVLPISNLARLERDELLFPTYTAQIGALMREETHRLLEYEIFEGSGSWQSALTAPYTFVNGPLASFYGMTGVTGEEFQRVDLDTSKRLGVLLQAGVLAGTIHSNTTNPVTRGSFIVQKLMCIEIPLPTGDIADQVKPPDPYSGDTARERYSQHSQDPVCASCHRMMDPVGLALENFDPVGLWRDAENGVTIDASGSVPLTEGTVNGPVELVKKIAETEEVHACFATHWLNFGYGMTAGSEEEELKAEIAAAFKKSGYRVRDLLLALTQTDAFLYLPTKEAP